MCQKRSAVYHESDNSDEIWQDLSKIYELICPVVTLKDGSEPKNWWSPRFAEMRFPTVNDIALSSQTATDICKRIDAFKEKANDNSYDFSFEERAIFQNLSEPQFELAVEMLTGALLSFNIYCV
jgi:hypothetical protein